MYRPRFLFSFLIATICTYCAHAQKYKAVTLCDGNRYELHSGSNSIVTQSSSRTIVSLNIPQNTVEVIFTVKSTQDKNPINEANLARVLASYLSHGASSIMQLLDNVQVPQGNAEVNVYLIPGDNDNINNFMAKKDKLWRQYNQYSCISTLGCKQMYQIQDVNENVCIGLINPSNYKSETVVVNAVAIVKSLF